MKKVFLFGRVTRIGFLLSFVFFLYAFADMCIQSQFAAKNILMAVAVLLLAVLGTVWIYARGVAVDPKTGSVKLILGLTKKNIHVRMLDQIEYIDAEKHMNLGMYFIVQYKDGHSEKLYYKFYRMSSLEEAQFPRIKRQLSELEF